MKYGDHRQWKSVRKQLYIEKAIFTGFFLCKLNFSLPPTPTIYPKALDYVSCKKIIAQLLIHKQELTLYLNTQLTGFHWEKVAKQKSKKKQGRTKMAHA